MTGWVDYRRRVLYEDDAVVVLDKPPGIAVVGERHDADLVDLAAEAGETVMPAHRIEKAYLAVVRGDDRAGGGEGGGLAAGTIDLPLAVGRKNRVRVAAPRSSIV